MKLSGLLSLCLLYLAICVINLRVSTCAGLLKFDEICEKNEDCKTYATSEAHYVLCDKISPTDLKGVCGCTGQAYNLPGNEHLINPKPWNVLGYAEHFDPLNEDLGCQRTQLGLQSCEPGSDTCFQEGIYYPSRPAFVCRNIKAGDDVATTKEEWRCTGRFREVKTYGTCNPGKDLKGNPLPVPLVNCELAGLKCSSVVSFDEAIYQACLPEEQLGVAEKDYFCHHDSDCKDPNAKCTIAFHSIKSPILVARRLCLCDLLAGYDFDLVNGMVKCTQRPSFGEICRDNFDCGEYDASDLKHRVVCNSYYTTSYKTCQCEFPLTDQFYEGVQKVDGKCRPFADYDEICIPNYSVGRDYRPVHNCRRMNNHHFTGLLCQADRDDPKCGCRPHSTWDSTQGICVRKFVDLDERCDPDGKKGLLQCNPKGNLECKEKIRGSKDYTCVCDSHSDRDKDFSYCQRRVETVDYGEDCDEITRICNDGKNLVCTVGKCECLTDEQIIDTGKKECRRVQRFKEKPKKPASAASDRGFHCFHLILIAVACVLGN